MAFKPVVDSGGGDVVKFEKPGTAVTGIYLGFQAWPEGKFGPTTKHIFKTEKGLRVAFFKDDSQPGNLLSQAKAGDLVRLTFTGTKPSKGGGNPMKLYSLDIDDEYKASDDDISAASTTEDDGDSDTPMDEVTTSAAARAPAAINRSAVNAVLGKSNRRATN